MSLALIYPEHDMSRWAAFQHPQVGSDQVSNLKGK
jgi:hypothetical protein